jgi:hypothetical protein
LTSEEKDYEGERLMSGRLIEMINPSRIFGSESWDYWTGAK